MALTITAVATVKWEAEVEHARGNLAAARQAAEEAAHVVTSVTALSHVIDLLPVAARVLPEERVVDLLDRVRSSVRDPSWEAAVAEAEGWMRGDAPAFARAASIYGSLDLPYEEARCRLEAGEFYRAGEILRTYGLENGPLGPGSANSSWPARSIRRNSARTTKPHVRRCG